MKPRALILTGYGLNTDYELAHAFELAGAQADRIHLNDVIARPVDLRNFEILAVPGGFAFADNLGAGKVMAERLRAHLMGELLEFVADGKLVMGICNGFQVLAKLGLLPATSSYGEQEVTLTVNDAGRFEDRWVHLRSEGSKCVFIRGIDRLELPVRHAEGKFVPRDDQLLEGLKSNGQVVLRYTHPRGGPMGYPWNPNGSIDDIAAICDPSGRIFGVMPHPEAFLYRYNHPRWTREELPPEGQGLSIFKNAVDYCQQHLMS